MKTKQTVKTSAMYERLLDRYLKGYVTDAQLDRYVALGQLTNEEAEIMRMEKHFQENPDQRPVILPE